MPSFNPEYSGKTNSADVKSARPSKNFREKFLTSRPAAARKGGGHGRRAAKKQAGPRLGKFFRPSPLAYTLSLLLLAGNVQAGARPFSSAWFAQAGVARTAAAHNPASGAGAAQPGSSALKQRQEASQQLQRSVGNLARSASLIASQQAVQAAARAAAQQAASNIPDGLAEGGLKVDANPLTKGWLNAKDPTQSVSGGKTTVTVEQTADKAILNWETFNVGKNTTLDFKQNASWAALNRVNDPNARPSQIQGRIKADGTVMIVNRNGVVFSGSSQVNVRNLVAAAANISDSQFNSGLYGANSAATFTDAGGAVKVAQGAQLVTHAPQSSTAGGGYVLLLGKETENAGEIATANGQTVLAAGDSFTIKKGYSTDGNQNSTTRGNEVTASGGGTALNSGLIRAATGDITLTGSEVRQQGVAVSTTSQDVRGTVHLTAANGVTLGAGSATAILLEGADASALDSQRDSLLAPAMDTSDQNIVAADKYRRDLSLVEIKGGTVDFAGDSLTLATGGQVAVEAASRALVRDGAVIDVSGALGVKVAMESNSVKVNVQGNELRDAAVNRDSGELSSTDVWVDARDLIYVPAGANGYESDRWYTAGGLLEVSGYLGTQGHGVGEWMAQGGTVSFAGNEVVTQAGSQINLSGGTLDVQSGKINLSWLKGSNGRLYEVSGAPADMLYTGIHKGYEVEHNRWGITETFYNSLIAPKSRLENGYTVGRDAGALVIGTKSAVLEGEIAGDTYQGERQTQAAQAGLDGYSQSQKAAARGAQLVAGQYTPYYVKESGTLQYGLTATSGTVQSVVLSADVEAIAAGLALDGELPEERRGALYLDTDQLNGIGLGALRIAAADVITVDDAVKAGNGGEITLYGPRVEVNADLAAHGGNIRLGNVLNQISSNWRVEDTTLAAPAGTTAAVTLAPGATLDASGLWSNLRLDAADISGLPYVNGGSVSLRSSGDVTLSAGSAVDVSSGAALGTDGSFSGGAGGDITLAANANGASDEGAFVLDGELRGYGVNGGGTLSLQAGSVMIGSKQDEAGTGALLLADDLFTRGFSEYQITGNRGVTVAEGAQVDVFMPVYRYGQNTLSATTSEPASAALELWTPPLYQEDAAAGALTQRKGAALTLLAGTAQSSSADKALTQALIGKGATVMVDPGQFIEVRSVGQLTVEGGLNAWGGRIELGAIETSTTDASGRSIWIGEQAVLDAAGRATVATDALGRRYGIVDAGGEIVIGGAFDAASGTAGVADITGNADADDLFVVVREGALLDASGASAVLDIPGMGAVEVAGAGGAITLATSNGLYIDGMLRAVAGGANAGGGALTLVLDTPLYVTSADERMRRARELVLSQAQAESLLAAGLSADGAADQLVYGYGAIGVDQVEAGGFDNLTLASDGLLSFDGDLSLTLGQSINLYAGVLGLSDEASADIRVSLAAPYVRLAGMSGAVGGDNRIHPTIHGGESTGVSQQDLAGTLLIQAGQLLEVRDQINVGVYAAAGSASERLVEPVDRRGFDDVQLVSGGDLRFLAATQANGTQLYAPGDLTLAAAQIYPATGANARVYAGWRGNGASLDPERVLTVARTTDETPAVPYAVFGSLTLSAHTIDQGGVLRAPLGALSLGTDSTAARTVNVNLLADSLTSVSAAGLVMPYGGTTDGVSWKYAGEQVALQGLGSLSAGSVTLTGQLVNVGEGAVIDISGGGELTGAGFVSGRGGSTDARYYPLAQLGGDGLTLPGLNSNPVYALVPGVQAPAAPAGGEAGAVDPLLGRQVTIGAGVPGLPAGTYTLLPSTYALLPGAFRVEINGLAGQGAATVAAAMRNGSYSASGVLSIAGTNIRDSLARQLILTPADVLRSYSQYNETSYTAFAAADAATRGVPRAQIEADAKLLQLSFTARDAESEELRLQFSGTVLGDAAEGGYGSTLAVLGSGLGIEILGDAAAPSADYEIALRASDLSKIAVNRLAIGGLPTVTYGQGGNLVRMDRTLSGAAASIVLRSGAELSAPEVMLITVNGAIEIEQGAVINTLDQGVVAYDSNDGFIYQPGTSSVVSVSNGVQQWLAPSRRNDAYGPGPILVGACSSGACAGTTQLYSEGTIAFVTDNDFQLDEAVRYGTRRLSLAVGAFNVGSTTALEAATARGALTPGLVLNQQMMERLLQGDASTGAPALETLELIAGDSVNFFESVTLSTLDADGNSLLDTLMLTTPAIYGYGDADDVALIRTGHLVWNGSADAPGALATDGAGTGSGVFQVEAERISFGYGSYGRPDGVSALDRLALGFAAVNLSASERVTANNAGTLAVYQSQGEYVAGEGYRYSGGDLNIVTPLLTGEDGAVSKVTAGGAIAVCAPAAGAADPSTITISELGGEWSLTAGNSLSVDTAVALPSGKLTLAAQGDVTLGDLAYFDLSGRSVEFFDDEAATQYSWGGDVILTSAAGNVSQAAGSVIDLSAEYNQAGSLTVTALGEAGGAVDLQGAVSGAASGRYDAGGTDVPYLAGRVTLRAQTLGGELSAAFAALNERLNQGEVYGLRSFQLKQGDLVIGDGLEANRVEVSLDGGHLTVAGTVDAGGERVGSIRLAGGQGLTLAGNALLDAHGTLLRLDSYGEAIDAANRAEVELNSGQGVLTLADGARIDLRHGTGDARVQADPALQDDSPRGRLELYAPRLGDDAGGDVAIDASGAYAIEGAQSIALNAMRRYDDAPAGVDEAVGGRSYQAIDQSYLDQKHEDSIAFISAALQNADLLNSKLAGLNNDTYRQAFHLRPGVEIVTAGDLVVNGDLDLSGYRYASLNPSTQQTGVYGAGEPGTLVVRAGGDISIYGSVSDGFAPPPSTPDDDGWVLTPGVQGYGGDVVVPRAGVVLAEGTRFPAGKVLNYDLPLQATTLAAGTLLPAAAQLAEDTVLPANTVLAGDVTLADGTLYRAGSVLGQALTLPAGSTLGAGFRLSAATSLQAMSWPKGVALPDTSGSATLLLADGLTLPLGALIPSMTDVVLPDGALSVNLRPEGVTTRNWAVAAMLPEGSLSWSLRLVAGADTEAADPRLTRANGKGDLVLADTHYGLYKQRETTVIPGTPETVIGGIQFWTEQAIDYWWVGEGGDWEYYGLSGPVKPGDPVVGVPMENGEPMAGYDSFCVPSAGCVTATYLWTEQAIEYWWVGEGGDWKYYGLSGPVKVGDPVIGIPMEDGKPMEGYDSFCVMGVGCEVVGEIIPGTPDQTVIGDVVAVRPATQNFSVLRTGTGDLDLIAGGDVAMQSLYGVYTAGTSTASLAGDQTAAFNQVRAKAADGTYLNTSNTAEVPEGEEKAGPLYEALVDGGDNSTYAAWYPDGGGNLLVIAGGDFTGDVLATYNPTGEDLRSQRSSAEVGNWLWRQASGDTAGVDDIPTSWWINFGTYVQGNGSRGAEIGAIPELVGFTGIGTLGGGNLTVRVAGDAGLITRRGNLTSSVTRPRSQGLVLTVASTGRVLSDGGILLTGGGDMTVSIGGGFNPGLTARATSTNEVSDAAGYRGQNIDLNGVLTNLRGDLSLLAGAVGGVALQYGLNVATVDDNEVRAYDPYGSSLATATGGPVLMLGDAAATLNTRGDLVVSGNGDPGRVTLPVSLPYTYQGTAHDSGGYGWFSLWTDNTAIDLFSAGGDLTPSVQLGAVTGSALNMGRNYSATDGRFVWPSQLSAAAAGGSLYLGSSALGTTTEGLYHSGYSLLLAPSANASLSLLAGDSIYAGGYVVSQSAASVEALPTPFVPAFYAADQVTWNNILLVHNLSADAIRPVGGATGYFPLFVFGAETASDTGDEREPGRFYARSGDIVGLGSGEILVFSSTTRNGQSWYEGGPVWMRAGRDIVRSGTLLGQSVSLPNQLGGTLSSISGYGNSTGNLFVHGSATDVSVVEAGRDILYSNFNVAGPGTLEVSAGRNILLAGQVGSDLHNVPIYGESAISSLGPVVAGDGRPGAGIVAQAGLGAQGADWIGLLDLYLDPANQADVTSGLPLADQPGKVAKTYEAELIAWLADRYGFVPAGDESAAADARAYFAALPAEQQRIFARQIYFAELRAGGREYNDAEGPRFGSYLRGREAIAALFPTADADGKSISYGGDVLAYGGAGIHTNIGGDIQVLTPGGAQTYGVEGEVPPATAGLITQGQGNIQLYSLGSILLGQSRIMTTFGGDILAWSAEGDINAGRGSKTTLVYTPPRRVYDQWGNVALSPNVPSTGAGIATLNPIPEVPAGDVDLIAPLGTIDAGEAGIRVSGNVNIAALRVVNAENIQVQGESQGLPVAVTVNVGALTSASQAASSAVQAAEQINRQTQGNRPSIISVEILGYGNERLQPGGETPQDGARNVAPDYQPDSAIQVLGAGPLSPRAAALLTQEEKNNLAL